MTTPKGLHPLEAIAVDWSGRATGAGEAIVLARARVADAELLEVTGGLDREAVVRRLVALLDAEPRTVVGLDFGFSFPRWYLDEQGWRDAPAAWAALGSPLDDHPGGAPTDGGRVRAARATTGSVDDASPTLAEALLAACEPPFWGRPGRASPPRDDARPGLRRTEREVAEDPDAPGTPKSVFQIGGAGAVGTGSLRGMPHLVTLRDAGARIWPVDHPRLPVVVEAWPRLSTGPLRKRRVDERVGRARDLLQGQPPDLVAAAVAGEDAFDAAVTAVDLARASHRAGGLALEPARDEDERLEGRIWRPPG